METPKKPVLHIEDQPVAIVIHCPLAIEIGLSESIVLRQIAFYIKISSNLRDGQWWTYQSVNDLQRKAFPFWGRATVARIVDSLIRKELIIATDQYNQRKSDRTRWFALNVEKIRTLKSVSIQMVEAVADYKTPSQNETGIAYLDMRLSQNETTISQNETTISQNETTLPEVSSEVSTEVGPAPAQLAPVQSASTSPTLEISNAQQLIIAWRNHTNHGVPINMAVSDMTYLDIAFKLLDIGVTPNEVEGLTREQVSKPRRGTYLFRYVLMDIHEYREKHKVAVEREKQSSRVMDEIRFKAQVLRDEIEGCDRADAA